MRPGGDGTVGKLGASAQDGRRNSITQVNSQADMGSTASVHQRNVLLLGEQGSGKTTLLYALKLNDDSGDFATTEGMNYEVITLIEGTRKYVLNIWDLPGKETLSPLWGVFSSASFVHVVVYIINANDRDSLTSNLAKLSELAYMDGLYHSQFVILLNVHDPSAPDKISVAELLKSIESSSTLRHRFATTPMLELNARTQESLNKLRELLCSDYSDSKHVTNGDAM